MIRLDSPTQEFWFSLWIEEAIKHGWIEKFIPEDQCPKFPLFDGLSKTWHEDKVVYKGTKREETRHLTHEHVLLYPINYGPDGIIVWTEKSYRVLFADINDSIENVKKTYFNAKLIGGKYMTVLDVKSPTGTNRNSDTPFQFTRKMMWDKHKILVDKVMLVPPKKPSGNIPKGYLFNEVWTPQRYLFTDKTLEPRKITSYEPKLAQEFLLI